MFFWGSIISLTRLTCLSLFRCREQELKEEKERKKREAAEERARKEAEKLAAARIAPEDMFRNDPAYAGFAFDETGLPVRDAGEGGGENESQGVHQVASNNEAHAMIFLRRG